MSSSSEFPGTASGDSYEVEGPDTGSMSEAEGTGTATDVDKRSLSTSIGMLLTAAVTSLCSSLTDSSEHGERFTTALDEVLHFLFSTKTFQ